jgi:hypothetical protein
MAYLENVRLAIYPDLATQTAKVTARCEVCFSEGEIAIMRRRPEYIYFQIDCRLLGKDFNRIDFLDSDDWIYTYPTKFFPAENINQVEPVCLEATLSLGLLNEDVIGTDEIYARLMLKGRYCFQDQFVSEETGVVAC